MNRSKSALIICLFLVLTGFKKNKNNESYVVDESYHANKMQHCSNRYDHFRQDREKHYVKKDNKGYKKDNKKEFFCTTCGMKFRTKAELNEHAYQVHGKPIPKKDQKVAYKNEREKQEAA
ncbi:MAG TPA: hypothetical protein VLG50_02600, partial [Candidatus Saccharimonadales bacterium]|nr:hypothetical protein [Candidatus Saccharimonadales bacterium]